MSNRLVKLNCLVDPIRKYSGLVSFFQETCLSAPPTLVHVQVALRRCFVLDVERPQMCARRSARIEGVTCVASGGVGMSTSDGVSNFMEG